MQEAIYRTYFKKKGQAVVDMNNASIEKGLNGVHKVDDPAAWLTAEDTPIQKNKPAFIQEVVDVMNRQEGNSLPVSTMMKFGLEDGTWPAGTSKFEKRGAAVDVPEWDAAKCLQCNQCSLVCPHAAIRPILLNEDEEAVKPIGFNTVPAKGMNGKYTYRLQVSPYDCTGCGSCVNVCLAKDTAITMKPLDSQLKETENWTYAMDKVSIKTENWTYAMDKVSIKKDAISNKNVKASQFAKPYFEFSGACAGCGQTPYIKLVSQLFGDRMYVANASGCSSAYGGAMPMTPYSCDSRGFGPCWEQSLFEDNAEFAYGFLRAHGSIHGEVELRLEALKEKGVAVEAISAYLAGWQDPKVTRQVSDDLIAALEKAEPSEETAFVLQNKEYLTKKSVWAFGGDGWAYDIGFGGIDHVLAQNRDINMLVMDTEVYSNTGGQSSKATPTAAVAKFAAGGKEVKKKDLGAIAMSYGYIYVAQVAMGYDSGPDPQGHPGGGVLSRPRYRHLLLPLPGARHQGRHELHAGRDEESRGMRLLAPVPL